MTWVTDFAQFSRERLNKAAELLEGMTNFKNCLDSLKTTTINIGLGNSDDIGYFDSSTYPDARHYWEAPLILDPADVGVPWGAGLFGLLWPTMPFRNMLGTVVEPAGTAMTPMITVFSDWIKVPDNVAASTKGTLHFDYMFSGTGFTGNAVITALTKRMADGETHSTSWGSTEEITIEAKDEAIKRYSQEADTVAVSGGDYIQVALWRRPNHADDTSVDSFWLMNMWLEFERTQ